MTPTAEIDVAARRYGTEVPGVLRNPVIDLQLHHRSVRRYLPTPVTDDEVTTIVAAAQSAATSSNHQVWSVVVVRDAAARDVLAGVANGQEHIRQAPVLLVFVADLARPGAVAAGQGIEPTALGLPEYGVVGLIDAALAAQNAALAAESLGLGTVFIGALRNNIPAVVALLDLPPGVVPVFGLVVGHPDPAENAEIKPRLPQSEVRHDERYDAAGNHARHAAYDTVLGDWYAARGVSDHSWRQRVSIGVGRSVLDGREQLGDRLREQGYPLG